MILLLLSFAYTIIIIIITFHHEGKCDTVVTQFRGDKLFGETQTFKLNISDQDIQAIWTKFGG